MSFRPGENVGPYQIIEQLGQGGMATVFKAYHANLDRYIAIKVLHAAFKQDANFSKRFEREAKVVAKLDHPNIVPVYDFAEHEGSSYLVMRYVEGQTLKAVMSRGPLDVHRAADIIADVADALTYAHGQGVLHRDVKPSNVIMSDEDSKIYLTDFGLARIAQSGESTLSQDMMLGTPAYMSPEQARGEVDLDAGTDIYSLAVMLYEMVVGRVPFSADTPYAIIHDHIYTPLPPPRTVNPNVPEPIERVLLKALAKERADRYDTPNTMMEAFRAAIDSVDPRELANLSSTLPMVRELGSVPPGVAPPPVSSTATSIPDRTEPLEVEKKPRSRRWLFIVGGLAAMVVCACLALAVLGNAADNAGNLESDIATAEVELATAEVELDQAFGDNPSPADQPSGLPPAPQDGHCLENEEALYVSLDEAVRGVEQAPDSACAHLALAVAYSQLDEPNGPAAQDELQQAMQLGLDAETLIYVGDLIYDSGDYGASVAIYGRAFVEHGSREGELWAFWALQDILDGDPDGRTFVERAIEEQANLAFPKAALATWLAWNNQPAEDLALNAVRSDPESPVAHYAMGQTFWELDQPLLARLQFACVMRSDQTPQELKDDLLPDIMELDAEMGFQPGQELPPEDMAAAARENADAFRGCLQGLPQ